MTNITLKQAESNLILYLTTMRFVDFEQIMSVPRMSRYVTACNGDTRKGHDPLSSQSETFTELFTVVGCFEVALRNAIDRHYSSLCGADWLRDSARPGACSVIGRGAKHPTSFLRVKIVILSHPKLLAEMDFDSGDISLQDINSTTAGELALLFSHRNQRSTHPSITMNSFHIYGVRKHQRLKKQTCTPTNPKAFN